MSHNTIAINSAEPDRAGDISVGGLAKIIAYGRGESDAYNNSSAVGFSVGDEIYFYDSSSTDTINSTPISNGWRSSFSLPAGKYIIKWRLHFEDTGSGWYMVSGLYEGTNLRGTCYIGETSGASSSNALGQAFVNLSTTTTLTFKVHSASLIDSVANQGTTPSQYGAFFVVEVA